MNKVCEALMENKRDKCTLMYDDICKFCSDVKIVFIL